MDFEKASFDDEIKLLEVLTYSARLFVDLRLDSARSEEMLTSKINIEHSGTHVIGCKARAHQYSDFSVFIFTDYVSASRVSASYIGHSNGSDK